MKQHENHKPKRLTVYVLTTAFIVFAVNIAIALSAYWYTVNAEADALNASISDIASEKVANTVKSMELNAINVFDEVGKHLDSPESVIDALKSKTYLNSDIRGYFAAFTPGFFPQRARLFEPYVFQRNKNGKFEVRQVASARHDYTKSDWYIHALSLIEQLPVSNDSTGLSFWSDPYYYYDDTNISGHYCTFVKPVFDGKGKLACVCGADITFEWLSKELEIIDSNIINNDMSNAYYKDDDFYTVILDNEGTCIAYPGGKRVVANDSVIISDLSHHKQGIAKISVAGTPSTIYYKPIEGINWSVAVVVPQHNIMKPLQSVAYMLLLTLIVGMSVLWIVCHKVSHERVD